MISRYLAHLEAARKYEAEALAEMRSALARLGNEDALSAAIPTGFGPTARTHGRSRGRRHEARSSRARLAAASALVIVVAALAWAVLRDDPPQSRATGAHAGHDMAAGSGEQVRLAPGSDIGVELGEFFVKADYNKVRSGEVTFEVENSGSTEHELMIASLEDLPQDQIAGMSGDEVHQKVLAAEHGITAGSDDATLTASLEPGKYILFCNLPGHFSEGQHTILRVA